MALKFVGNGAYIGDGLPGETKLWRIVGRPCMMDKEEAWCDGLLLLMCDDGSVEDGLEKVFLFLAGLGKEFFESGDRSWKASGFVVDDADDVSSRESGIGDSV